MKKIALYLFLISTSIYSMPNPCDNTVTNGFFPKNTLSFPVTFKSINLNKSESNFNLLLKRLEDKFDSTFIKKNKKLIFDKKWECASVNAYATRGRLRESDNVSLDEAIVMVSGGLYRHPLITDDAFSLVICHELGHHLGGSPRKLRGNTSLIDWASAEGQADYFATAKCMRKIISKDDTNLESIPASFLDKSNTICNKDLVCNRILYASYIAAKVFASLNNSQFNLDILNRDPSIVYTTNLKHARPQCRLDTFIAGAICPITPDIGFDDNDFKIGSCLKNFHSEGSRPECWFQPSAL